MQAYNRADYGRANQLCDQLLLQLKSEVDLLNLKAMSCLALGQIEVAEKAIRAALKLKPGMAGVHLNAALVYQADGRYKQVKRHALEAVQLAPREAPALYQAAQQSFEKAVSLQPLNARALSMLVKIRDDRLSDQNVVAMLQNICETPHPDRTGQQPCFPWPTCITVNPGMTMRLSSTGRPMR